MRELILFAILIFSVLSSERILIYNEEILVAVCLVGFVYFSQNTLSDISRATFGARREAIQTDLQHFLSSQEALWSESEEQHELLLFSLRPSTQMIAELFLNGMVERCAPLYEQTVQALLCQEMELQLEALLAIREHSRLRERDEIVSCFRFLVGDEFGGLSSGTKHQSTLIQPSMVFLEGEERGL